MPIDEHGETLSAAGASESAVVGGRYVLLGLLGSGGMGNVYRAHDRELDEPIALKVLRTEVARAPGAIERFRREVKLARRVTHENVARVFDIGEHGSDRILTMELVDGTSLATRIHREGALAPADAAAIARAICAGVGAAHAAGVVHRDLKPENVLLSREGRVVVTDFGIARAATEGARTIGILGTPAYMAPEQIDERVTIDHRADIYAFGAVLYEMLVGEPAWKGESLWALAAARLIEPPPDPRALQPDLPSALADLVVSCMARDPAARPQTIAEVERALGALHLESAPRVPASAPPPRPASGLTTTGTDKRVAVLPFANLGPVEQDYVADGLTEDLIDALSIARGLRVRPRGVVMPHRGTNRDLRDVGRELDVQVVVDGSVRRTPNGFRINARLVSVADGFQLWARRFDVPEAELLAHNDAIAHAIAEALTVDLETPVRAAPNADAVDLYLRACAAHRSSFGGDPLEPVRLFDRVLALTPDDPRALAGRAKAGAHQTLWSAADRQASYDAAKRAIALAPLLPDAYVGLANLHTADGDYASALEPLKRALALAPLHAEAHENLGRILVEVDLEQGRPHLEQALALEPTFEFPYIQLASYWELYGEHERVEALLEQSRERGIHVAVQLETIFVIWRRDTTRAQELLEAMDPANPRHQMGRAWLEMVATGVVPPPAPPPVLPPGLMFQHFMLRFLTRTEVDVACFARDLPRALAALERLDALGTVDVGWLERLPLLAELRALPEAEPIRARFAERAERVRAAYRAL